MYAPASGVPTRHREMLLSSLEIISSLALGISDDRSRFRCPTMSAVRARRCTTLSKKGTRVTGFSTSSDSFWRPPLRNIASNITSILSNRIWIVIPPFSFFCPSPRVFFTSLFALCFCSLLFSLILGFNTHLFYFLVYFFFWKEILNVVCTCLLGFIERKVTILLGSIFIRNGCNLTCYICRKLIITTIDKRQ